MKPLLVRCKSPGILLAFFLPEPAIQRASKKQLLIILFEKGFPT
jgi:hypothetical protein